MLLQRSRESALLLLLEKGDSLPFNRVPASAGPCSRHLLHPATAAAAAAAAVGRPDAAGAGRDRGIRRPLMSRKEDEA